MSTTGINTSLNTLRSVIKKLADLQTQALTNAVENITSGEFNKLDQEVIEITNCKFLLESTVKAKWQELDGERLVLSIEQGNARLHQLEQYFNHAPEEDHYELKPAIFAITNELFDLKRRLHILENQNLDFDLPIDAVSMLIRFKFIEL